MSSSVTANEINTDSVKSSFQEKLRQRSLNTGKSWISLTSSATAIIPLADPPLSLPSYVLPSFSRTSEWHTAAILSMAVESATLRSRLRRDVPGQLMLSDWEELLDVNEKRRIAQLRVNVISTDQDQDNSRANKGKFVPE
jgi:hypothetical protein